MRTTAGQVNALHTLEVLQQRVGMYGTCATTAVSNKLSLNSTKVEVHYIKSFLRKYVWIYNY